jgi:hypothetical protein
MLELLFPEEDLFAGTEDEILTAIHAFKDPVGEFHRSTSPDEAGPAAQIHGLGGQQFPGFGAKLGVDSCPPVPGLRKAPGGRT